MLLHNPPSKGTAILKYGLCLSLFIATLLFSSASYSQDKDKVYDFVSTDTPPTFPGGMDKFYQYLAKTVKYPEQGVKNGVQGKVFLSYIVEKDGSLSDVKVVKGIGSGLDEEALRVIKNSPKWIPGTSKGAPVRVKYNIPMAFTLSK